MAEVLLVVDMLVGFMEEDHDLYCGDAARDIIPAVQSLIEQHHNEDFPVIFICDSHEPDDLEFEVFPEHCIKGSGEAEIIHELRGYDGFHISKRRYSAFFDTDLDATLSELNPDTVTICGVCTDICVMHTAADARNRDYRVKVYADGVASFDLDAHRMALKHMEDILGVSVIR